MKKIVTSFLLISFIAFTSCSLFGSDDDTDPAIPGKLVFSAEAGETYQIFTMNADGSDFRQLTDFDRSGAAVQPSWSPDGDQIVFTTTLNSSSNGFSIYIMNADGSNMHPLHPRPGSPIPTPGSYPKWSSDGSQIVWHRCVSCQVGTNIEIFSYTFATDSVRQLTHTDYPITNTTPIWSPDGSRIAFVSDRDYVEADTLRFRKDLYVMDVDGSHQKRLTESGFPGGYTWKNLKKIILTSTDRDTNLKDIFSLNIETGERTFLMADLKVKDQLWTFWDSVNQQLLTINKNHKELPVIVASYDANGKLLHQFQLNSKKLESAIGFDWYINKE